ncbi:MAG: FHA domain-containing protein [Chloroflexi bacterium]|nr:FHA domain-containing protein [Chloroflexota bacterium]
MIACPSCQTSCHIGAFFCPECGARLPQEGGQATHTFRSAGAPASAEQPPGNERAEAVAEVTLVLVKSSVRVPLSGAMCSIGRVDRAQAVLPEVDLNPYGGYQQGVSRLHATIQQDLESLTITDLASANGTFLNGRRLEPHRAYPLRQGDLLAFGKLEAVVSLHQAARMDHAPRE